MGKGDVCATGSWRGGRCVRVPAAAGATAGKTGPSVMMTGRVVGIVQRNWRERILNLILDFWIFSFHLRHERSLLQCL